MPVLGTVRHLRRQPERDAIGADVTNCAGSAGQWRDGRVTCLQQSYQRSDWPGSDVISFYFRAGGFSAPVAPTCGIWGPGLMWNKLIKSFCKHIRIHTLHFTNPIAPCRLWGCKNGPAPFPGWMSYKATKPDLVCLSYLSMLYYFCCGFIVVSCPYVIYYPTVMAQYSLLVLKVPLNPKQTNKLFEPYFLVDLG